MSNKKRRVVVTGIGIISAIGNNVNDFQENLKAGNSGATIITKFQSNETKSKIAFEVKNIEFERYFNPKYNTTLDLASKYAVLAANEAIRMAKPSHEALYGAGVIWGSATGGTLGTAANQVIDNIKKNIPINLYFLSNAVTSASPANIAIANKMYGINYSVSSTCSSANQAILNAAHVISSGLSDVIIAGGSEAPISEVSYKAFEALNVLSSRNISPTDACRPFDRTRDGMVLGEGSGALMLESLEHAEKRGAEIICEIGGGASTSDAFHVLAPNPKGTMISKTISLAAESAGINLNEIDIINLHGTATPRGDSAELAALLLTFGNDLSNQNFIATKSLTGHTLGASGAISSIISALILKNNFIPRTINFKNPDEDFEQNNFTLTRKEKLSSAIKSVMVNSFGFGGHNVSLVLKKYKK